MLLHLLHFLLILPLHLFVLFHFLLFLHLVHFLLLLIHLLTAFLSFPSAEQHIALSQYPRPGMHPTKHPNSDKPKLRNIKIMGYSLRSDFYRYTLWVRFHPHNFSRGEHHS